MVHLHVRPALRMLVYGFCAGLCAVSEFVWPLTLLFLVLWVRSLSEESVSLRDGFWRGIAFGLGYAGVLFSWTFSWLGLLVYTAIPMWIAVMMSFYSWVLTVGSPVFGYGLWAMTHVLLRRYVHNPHALAIVSSLAFVVWELVGVFFFHLTLYGDGATLAPHFTFALFGYVFAHNIVALQLAWLGGVWVLSFVCIYAAIALNEIVYARRYSFVAALVCIALMSYGTYMYRLNNAKVFPTMAVGLVYTNFDTNFATDEESSLRHYAALNSQLVDLQAMGPSLVLLPEGTNGRWYNVHAQKKGEVSGFTGLLEQGATVADSGPVAVANEQRTRIQFLNTSKPVASFADKRVLLPQGEYVPRIQEILQSVIGNPGSFASLQNQYLFSPGTLNSNARIREGVVGTRFCSESMSPFLYLHNAYAGAELLLNVASHSWFVGNTLLTERTEKFAQVRAVESSRWYVQAGNKTSSLAVNPLGEIVVRLEEETPRAVLVELRTDTSPYQYLANKVMYAFGY